MNEQTNMGSTKWFIGLIFIAAIIGIFVFLTGKNLPDFLSSTKTPKLSTWISCDSNVSMEDAHFTWKGPGVGICTVKLGTDEFIVGTGDSQFQESIFSNMRTDRCAAFVLRGPLELTFSMNKGGGGDFYSSAIYQESFLKAKYAELDAHPTCNQNVRGYDKIECMEGICRILP